MTEILQHRVKSALAEWVIDDVANGRPIWNATNRLRRVNVAGAIREGL